MAAVVAAQVPPEVLQAHPVAVLAIPAFIPMVGVVATILWIARKDRQAERQELQVGEAPLEKLVQEPVEVPEEPRRPWRDRLPRLVIGDED